MKEYGTIKDLVLDYFKEKKEAAAYDELTTLVKKHFPTSKWKKSHWNWYRTKIKQGKFKKELEGIVPVPTKRSTNDDTERIKALADPILERTRKEINDAAKDDPVLLFKIRRWVYTRLLQEEVKFKRPIKKALWKSGMRSCQSCGEEFSSSKNVEIHRKDSSLDYSIENCVLLCRNCHKD